MKIYSNGRVIDIRNSYPLTILNQKDNEGLLYKANFIFVRNPSAQCFRGNLTSYTKGIINEIFRRMMAGL